MVIVGFIEMIVGASEIIVGLPEIVGVGFNEMVPVGKRAVGASVKRFTGGSDGVAVGTKGA